MANVGAASTDFIINGVRQNVFDGSKTLSHGMYDLLGNYGPSLGRAVSSPGNSLGPVGIEATGNMFGTLMSHKLKQQ